MKLALIILGTPYDAIPPIGLVSIYSYIKKHSEGVDIKIIDLNFDGLEKIESYQPDIIGVSAMSPFYKRIIALARKIKSITKAPIILGGTHITALPKLKGCFDIGVIGEGEQTMLELCELYQKEGRFEAKDLKKIKGIVFRDEDKLIKTEQRELLDLDKLPMMDFLSINKAYFKKQLIRNVNIFAKQGYLLTSRGCPFKCVFCASSIFWRCIIRFHSAERVVDEIEDQYKVHGSTHFVVWDDLFASNLERLKKIAELLERKQLLGKISFECQSRVNVIDEERVKLLKKIGVKRVVFGFESGSENYLKYLKKGSATIEQGKNTARLCNKHGLAFGGNLIFGGPGETIEDMEESLKFMDFLLENNVSTIATFILTPLPSTEIWEIAKSRGKVADDMDWDILIDSQNAGNPLLLDNDIDIGKFKEIYHRARIKVASTRKKGIFSIIKNNPIDSARFILTNPCYVINSIRKIIKGEHQDAGQSFERYMELTNEKTSND